MNNFYKIIEVTREEKTLYYLYVHPEYIDFFIPKNLSRTELEISLNSRFDLLFKDDTRFNQKEIDFIINTCKIEFSKDYFLYKKVFNFVQNQSFGIGKTPGSNFLSKIDKNNITYANRELQNWIEEIIKSEPELKQEDEKPSIVVNLFGGPGVGKSTLSAKIYSAIKERGISAELCREYVKDWAYKNRKIGQYDQIYITGQQINKESTLYHNVDYIITDSPCLLGPFYQEYYTKVAMVKDSVLSFMNYAKSRNIIYKNYFITRQKPYDPVGRYENEEEANKVSDRLESWLNENLIDYKKIDVPIESMADYILEDLGLRLQVPHYFLQ